MKKTLIVIIALMLAISMLTACDKDKKTVEGSITSSLESNDSFLSVSDSSSIEENTTVTTATTTQTPTTTTAPNVTTTKKPTTTVKVTVSPPSPTTPPQKQLIVPTAAHCQVIENEIIRLVNEYRSSLGLPRYTVENKLMQAAGIRAEEASRPNCYMHKRPNGDPWGTVLDQVQYGTPYQDISIINGQQVTQTLYDSGAGSENLASRSTLSINQQFYFNCTESELKKIAQSMFDGWKASADHNKSMISTICTKIGVGVYAKAETTLQNDKDIGFYGIQTFTQK